jgi:hypothetical protein
MKRLAIFLAAFTLGVAAMVGGVAAAPAGALEAFQPPRAQDECMCGGTITLQFYSRNFTDGQTYCTYKQLVNGQFYGRYMVYVYEGNVSCPQ